VRSLFAIFALVSIAGTAIAQTSVSFPTQDGGVVFADIYGSGSGALVLAHGGQFDKESWEKQARVLVQSGYRVLALDFRGYGDSKGPNDADPKDGPLYLDVLAAVHYLHRTGAKTVSVIGGSMGGAAAGDACIVSRPGEIDRVVMLGAAPDMPANKLHCPALFIVARDDTSGSGPRLPGIRAQYELAPQPKKMVILDGSAHAQYLFGTDQSERVMHEILSFLAGK
jgi:pimeloyl-ACP methyl ester carboxylesterase